MTTAFRIIVTALLIGILDSQVGFDTVVSSAAADSVDIGLARRSVASPETTTESAPDPLAFDDATPEQIELVTDAVVTFESAGMELPPLVVTFDATGETCKGHPGLFRSGTPATVVLCTELRHVVLHELAHAWEWHTVDDDARDDFVRDHDLESWNSKDSDWHDRGVEQFADTVAIGFVLENGSESPVVMERLCSFEEITGVDHQALSDSDCDRVGRT